jgi:PAS domain S-box-containing protein
LEADQPRELVTRCGERELSFLLVPIAGRDYANLYGHDVTDRNRAEAKIHRQHAVVEGINRIFREALAADTDQAFGTACLSVAQQVTGSRFGFLGELNPDGLVDGIAIIGSGRDACGMASATERSEVPKGLQPRGLFGQLLRGKSGFFTNDPASHPDGIGVPDSHPPLAAFLGVPLVHGGRTVGLVGVGNREGGYRESDREDLEDLAPAISQALVRRRGDQALLSSEQRLKSFFDLSPDLMVVAGFDGFFRRLSPSWEQALGYPLEVLTARPWLHFVHPADHPDTSAAASRLLAGETVTLFVNRYRCQDGSFRWIEWHCVGVPEQELIYAVARDVTGRKQAEEVLRRYELLAGQSRDIILFMRRDDGRILEANAAANHAYGYDHEELLGLKIMDLRAPNTVGLTAEQMDQVDTSGILFETEHRRKNGSIFPVEVSARGATVEGVRTLVSVIRDITERRKAQATLRESREDLNRAQAVAHTGSWRLDVQHNQLLWSDENHRIFGIPRGTALTYETFLGVVHPEDREYVHQRWSAGLRGEPYDIEHRLLVGNEVKWVHERAELEFDGEGTLLGGFGTTQDITGLKRAEAALHEAVTAAQAANRAKSEFLARMSHEIRTPMNGIMGMTELALLEGVPPKARKYLELAKQSAGNLLDIVNDILDIARIEAGRVELEQAAFEVRRTVEAIVSTLGVAAHEKGLRLRHRVAPAVPAVILGDEGRLRQVLTNLVGNAVKFTEIGEVALGVQLDGPPAEPGGQARLLFTVRDTGIGIGSDDLSSIFDSFSQATRSTHAKYGGSGLGLAIARHLTELMGGEIRAESQPGRGSAFSFTAEFTVAQEEPAASASDSKPCLEPASRRLRILLAEDNPISQIFAKALLEKQGHSVVAVSDGAQALEALAEADFEVVLMDVQMPGIDGLETVRRIRTGEASGIPRDIPIVALTAHALKGDRERFLRAGMDDYLSKPLDLAEARQVLQRIGDTRHQDPE